MGHDSLLDALLMLAWLWLCLLGWWAWRYGRPGPLQAMLTPAQLTKKGAKEPAPVTGLIHKYAVKRVNPSLHFASTRPTHHHPC